MCVQYAPALLSLITPVSDRAGYEYLHHRCQYTTGHVPKICGDTGGRNKTVSDIRMFRCASIHSRLLDSEQVTDSSYYETQHPYLACPVHLTERLTPIALIGAAGIGKTPTTPTPPHDDRMKQVLWRELRIRSL